MQISEFLKLIDDSLGNIWWEYKISPKNDISELKLFSSEWNQKFDCSFRENEVRIDGWPIKFNNSIVDEKSAKNVLYDAAWEYAKWSEKNDDDAKEIYEKLRI
jgi:hypothetical protein